MSFSSQIKKYRKEIGLTQEQFADEIGVTAQAVSKWERGGAPDICMLPIIANFFHVTIDELLENHPQNVHSERTILFSNLSLKEPEEKIKLITAFLRKYPKDSDAMLVLIHAFGQLPREKMTLQLPKMRELCERILSNTNDPDIRNSAVMEMCKYCPEDERDEWLSLLPEIVFVRRQNIRAYLAFCDKDHDSAETQMELLMFLQLSEHLKNNVSYQMGIERTRRQSVYYMRVIETLSDDTGSIPAGWLCRYAYEQLVLSAALFALQREDEAWIQFTESIERFGQWFAFPKDEPLSTGFDRIKVSKNHSYAFFNTADGCKHSEFIGFSTTHSCSLTPSDLLHFLTSSQWAMFDSARGDQRYLSTVDLVKKLI